MWLCTITTTCRDKSYRICQWMAGDGRRWCGSSLITARTTEKTPTLYDARKSVAVLVQLPSILFFCSFTKSTFATFYNRQLQTKIRRRRKTKQDFLSLYLYKYTTQVLLLSRRVKKKLLFHPSNHYTHYKTTTIGHKTSTYIVGSTHKNHKSQNPSVAPTR